MVLGCISTSGVGDFAKIGIMTAQNYQLILIHHAVPSGKHWIGKSLILQRDNDPKLTTNAVKVYVDRKTLKQNTK